ncbi:MAG: nitroreductase family protein [Candidatus Dormibacteraceae bacterium]
MDSHLVEIMRTTGSTRRHRLDPVAGDLIHRVLDSARYASSGGNQQPWRVVVVREEGVRRRLGELYRRSWYEFHAPLFTAKDAEPQPNYYADHQGEVPVHLVVLVAEAGITTTIEALDTNRVIGGASIYPFVQNLILGLRDEGLGTTLTTVLVAVEDDVHQLLGIPSGYRIAAHLAVGWPATPFPRRLSRRPVAEFATVDRFDGPPFTP